MIINYSVKNFYSIGEKGATVNFAVDGNAPKTNLYIDKGIIAGRISLVETVIGPNASGKTKLLQGIAFINYLLTSSYSSRPTAHIPFQSNVNSRKSSSEVSTRFVIGSRVFEYLFVMNREMILKEELKEFSKTTERNTAKTIYSRAWNSNTNEYDFTDKELGISSQTELRKNASMVSSAMQKDAPSPLAKLISDYWDSCIIVHNLWAGGNIEDADTGAQRLKNSLEKLLDPENKELADSVKQVLSRYDIGFDDFFDQVVNLPTDEKIHIYGIKHKFSEKEFTLQMREESSGTKRLVVILTDIVNALLVDRDGLAVIDEIDAFLHPDIIEALVDLFIQPETNPNKAQLLFSTHNHRILESLDKQQIILTEKNEDGETESWRLDEMNEVKSIDNYYTKYITGAYGARPRIES